MGLYERIIAQNSSVFIIAEAGVNHNGDIQLAGKMIEAAAEAGADAVKFQSFRAERLVTSEAEKANYQKKNTGNDRETQYEMLKKLELNEIQHRELMEHCQRKNILFLSTPFDLESAALLGKIGVQAYKISSGDLTNIPLIEAVASCRRPVIISTGMGGLGEVEAAVAAAKRMKNEELILLHCTTSYPAAYREVNLRAMLTLKEAFQLPVGYSDHTPGLEIPAAAAALGARVIEKHFTFDKDLPGPDHRISLAPDELKDMVRYIRNVEAALGDGSKSCTAGEKEAGKTARKSIVAACDIPKGTVITRELLTVKRPGTGLPPAFIKYLLGKRAKVTLNKDFLVDFWDFE